MLPDLPELFLDLLCGHLSYEDVLVLRTTCKGLREFVDQKRFTKLNLFVKKFSYHHRLFCTGDLVGYPYSFHSDDLTIFASSRFQERFCNVRRMIISGISPYYSERNEEDTMMDGLNLDHLNHFKRLNHLEIDEMPFRKSSCLTGKLNLPELQIASFTPMRYSGSSFELNCPKLRALKLKWCSPVLSRQTNGLNTLEFYGEEPDYLTKYISNLQKLSSICTYSIGRLLQFLRDLETNKLSLPLLAEMRLDDCGELSELDELASKLEDFRRDPKTKRIKFTFNGKPIDSSSELRKIIRLINTLDFRNGFHLNFYILTDDMLSFVNRNPMLNFLLSAVRIFELSKNIELSEEMIKRLEKIKSLNFGEQCKPNESTFELFAIHCKFVIDLTLYKQTVTKRLLEMMANHLVNLQSISIYTCKIETIEPLVKFRNLEIVKLDLNLQRDELSFIYKNSLGLEEVNISSRANVLRTTTRPKVYKISIKLDQCSEFDTFEAMMDYYEKTASRKRKDSEASTRICHLD